MAGFVPIIETRAAKTSMKGKAGRLCLHDAAREKSTTSDEVLGKELGDDMLDVAKVDPVDNTGDRLTQNVPRETLIFRTAVILYRSGLESAQSCRGHVHTARAREYQLCKFCHCVELLRPTLFAFRPLEFNGGHACSELVLTLSCERERRPLPLECPLIYAVEVGEGDLGRIEGGRL